MLVDVRLLGGFAVVVDGEPAPAERWSRRQGAGLVKLLALSPDGRLHRDLVIDTLWPDLGFDTALPRLHKAAHHVRVALDQRAAIVIRNEMVALFPDDEVVVDAIRFEAAARASLAHRPFSADACAAVLDRAAELLPDDRGTSWLAEPRDRLRVLSAELARAARRWEDLLRLDRVDEEAHTELIREALARGNRSEALRRFHRMKELLDSELGVAPSADAIALRAQAMSSSTDPAPRSDLERAPTSGRSNGVLVERDAQLDELTGIVGSAIRDRRGVVIVVSGEAGAGKSALVRALVSRLEDEVAVFVGGCDDLLAPRSLGPFRDMAEQHPELADAMSSPHLEEVLPAVLRTVSARASIVVIEDVHWADDATLDVIRYVARRLVGVAAALVLTVRDTDISPDHPVRQVLGGLTGLPVRRVGVGPLSIDAVRRLSAVSADEAAEIVRVTGGNPFFVTEVLATPDAVVPATVRDAVLARVGRLSPPVRALLRRLAVVPTRASRKLAERLADGDRAVVVEAERSGVVASGTDWVSFRHELARQAIETSLLPGERIEADSLVVEALLAQPEVDAARVVHHGERAGLTDLVLGYGPRAAEEASALGSHRQAAEILRVVLEHTADLRPSDIAGLSTRRAYSLYVVNRYAEALTCAECAVRAAETADDVVLLGDALLVLSRVALFARGPARARDAAGRALRLLPEGADDMRRAAALIELARTYSNLPAVGIVPEPCVRAGELSEQALALAQRLNRPDLTAQALCYRGDARLAAGDPRGADDLEQGTILARSDPRVETQVRAYVNAAGGAYRTGRFEQATRYVAAGLQVAADGEFFAGQYRLRLTAATVRSSRGEWDAAIADLHALIDAPGEPGVMAALARSVLARLLARRGDPAAASILEEALSHPGCADDALVTGVLTVAAVECGWLDGTLGDLTPGARRALELTDGAYPAIHAELCAYLRRAGVPVRVPTDAPGPWEPTLQGRWGQAARAWADLGERYERAVVLAAAPDPAARDSGVGLLRALGAVGTIAAV